MVSKHATRTTARAVSRRRPAGAAEQGQGRPCRRRAVRRTLRRRGRATAVGSAPRSSPPSQRGPRTSARPGCVGCATAAQTPAPRALHLQTRAAVCRAPRRAAMGWHGSTQFAFSVTRVTIRSCAAYAVHHLLSRGGRALVLPLAVLHSRTSYTSRQAPRASTRRASLRFRSVRSGPAASAHRRRGRRGEEGEARRGHGKNCEATTGLLRFSLSPRVLMCVFCERHEPFTVDSHAVPCVATVNLVPSSAGHAQVVHITRELSM